MDHHLHSMLNTQLSAIGINRGGRNNEVTVYAQVIFSLARNQQTVHWNSSALNLLWSENKPLEVSFLSLYSHNLTDKKMKDRKCLSFFPSSFSFPISSIKGKMKAQ